MSLNQSSPLQKSHQIHDSVQGRPLSASNGIPFAFKKFGHPAEGGRAVPGNKGPSCHPVSPPACLTPSLWNSSESPSKLTSFFFFFSPSCYFQRESGLSIRQSGWSASPKVETSHEYYCGISLGIGPSSATSVTLVR
ncbi:hypothetical protein TNCV_2069401 [Trichonephila clavipes]|uniref:Uncharacterized protein n=1 Tax=Trichonephila clavipes TaxID=2585209 RepID=A0A8X6W2Y9_TRICX|nr:hypothetical protein TNCV_2069401 [Trichonephila clavipes]